MIRVTTYPVLVGQIIKRERKRELITQAHLARLMDMSQSKWSRLESGKVSMDIGVLAKCAHFLETSSGAILTAADHLAMILHEDGTKTLSCAIEKKMDDGFVMMSAKDLQSMIATSGTKLDVKKGQVFVEKKDDAYEDEEIIEIRFGGLVPKGDPKSIPQG